MIPCNCRKHRLFICVKVQIKMFGADKDASLGYDNNPNDPDASASRQLRFSLYSGAVITRT